MLGILEIIFKMIIDLLIKFDTGTEHLHEVS